MCGIAGLLAPNNSEPFYTFTSRMAAALGIVYQPGTFFKAPANFQRDQGQISRFAPETIE